MVTVAEILESFYDIILDGDTERLVSVFAGEPSIDTPLEGRINGSDAFFGFVDRERHWLLGNNAKHELMALTADGQRMCAEIVLYMQQDERNIDLPVAIVADLDGKAALVLRVYHSTWPLTGKHKVRAPLMEPEGEPDEPQFVRQYMQALDMGDAAKIVDLFEDDGYAREPSGATYMHSGKDGLRDFYSAILRDGGISLRHCTATFDGKRVAIEYIAESWGMIKLPPQAGVAVYELGKKGKMHAARIYDDVTPPGEE